MRPLASLALVATVALVSGSAHAQLSDEETKAAARAAYFEGVELQERGEPAEALARFEAAQALFDAPTHLLRIGQCQALTGKLVEAAETYEALIRRPLGDAPPPAFVNAQAQGRAELTALRARIPTLRVTVTPDPRELSDLRIFVDERQVPAELAGIARPVNPGRYTLRAVARGWATTAPVEVDVHEREAQAVDLTLEPGGAAGSDAGLPPVYGDDSGRGPALRTKTPSRSGLLVGVRPVLLGLGGSASDARELADIATAGLGAGIDVRWRLEKQLLIGGTLEYVALGKPASSSPPDGWTSKNPVSTVFAGAVLGIVPNIERVSFMGEVGLGARVLARTASNPGSPAEAEETFSGAEIAVSAGLSFPAGALRIVPKVGLGLGSLAFRSCSVQDPTHPADCGERAGGHALFSLGVGFYYHLDFAKRPPRPIARAAVE